MVGERVAWLRANGLTISVEMGSIGNVRTRKKRGWRETKGHDSFRWFESGSSGIDLEGGDGRIRERKTSGRAEAGRVGVGAPAHSIDGHRRRWRFEV